MTPKNGKFRSLHSGIGFFFVLALAGCQQAPPLKKPDRSATTPIADEVSLKADRSQFDEMRKEIPEDVRRDNDELAYVEELVRQSDEEPGKIREKFSKAVHNRREKFDKAARKRRDEFNGKEKRDRDEFLKKAQKDRDDFMKKNKKARAEKRKEFFDDQDAKRQSFFAGQREARSEFEAQETEARRTFEAYMTEKSNKFNGEMRDYTSTYYDRRKNLDLKKQAEAKAKKNELKKEITGGGGAPAANEGSRVSDPDLEQFKQIPKTPATQLVPPGDQ